LELTLAIVGMVNATQLPFSPERLARRSTEDAMNAYGQSESKE